MPRSKSAPFVRCAVNGCGRDSNKPGAARGYCAAHYRRFKLYGDPLGSAPQKIVPSEQWIRDVALNFEGDDCLIWPFQKNENGYGVIAKGGRPHIASRVICERAYGLPDSASMHAAHNCHNGSGGCVNPRHLEWKTATDNERDKVAAGTDNAGSRHGQSLLSEADVRIIRDEKSISAEAMALRFGVSKWTIFDIRARRRWRHIP